MIEDFPAPGVTVRVRVTRPSEKNSTRSFDLHNVIGVEETEDRVEFTTAKDRHRYPWANNLESYVIYDGEVRS